MSHFDTLNGGSAEGHNQLNLCTFICKLFEPSKKKPKSSLKQPVSATSSLKLPQLDGRSVIISKKLSTGNDTFSFHRTFNQNQQPSDIARESIEPLMRKLVFEGSSLCIVHAGFKARKYSLDTVSNVDDGLYGVLLSDLFAKLAAGNLLNSQSSQPSATIRLSIFDVSCEDESVVDLLSHENSILSVDSPMTAREIEDIDDFLEAIQVAESNPFQLETPATRVCRLQIHGTENYSELNILHLTINTASQSYYLALMKECSNRNNNKTKQISSSQSLQSQQQQLECGLSRVLSSGINTRTSQLLFITQLLNATSSHDANLLALKFSRKVQSIVRQDEEQIGKEQYNSIHKINLNPSCYWSDQLYSQPLSTNPETPVHNNKNYNTPTESLQNEINTLIISLKDAILHPPIDRPSVLFPQWIKHQQQAVDVLFQMIARAPEKQRVSFFESALMIKSKLTHLAKISTPDRQVSQSNKRTASSPNLKTPLKMFEYFETQQFELDSRRKLPENKRVSLSGSDFKISRNSSMKSFQAGNTPVFVGILNNHNVNGSYHSNSSIGATNAMIQSTNGKISLQNQENHMQSGQYGSCRVKRLQKERQLLITTNSDQHKHHNPSLFHKNTQKTKKTSNTPTKYTNTGLFVDNGYALPRKPALSRKQSILSEKSNISRKSSKSSRSNSKSSIKSLKKSRQSNNNSVNSLSSVSSKRSHNRSTSSVKQRKSRRNSECSFSSPKKNNNLKSILVSTPLKSSNKTKHSSFPSSPRPRTPILKRSSQLKSNSPHSAKKVTQKSPRSSLKKKKTTLMNVDQPSRSIRPFNTHRSGSMGQLSDIVSSETQMRNEFREQLKSRSKKKYQSAKEEVLNSSDVSSESDYEFFDRVTDMNRRTINGNNNNNNNNLASQKFKDMNIMSHFDKELAFFDSQQASPNAVELLKAFHSLIIKSMSMEKITQELQQNHQILQTELQAEQNKYKLLQEKHLKRKKKQRIIDRDIQQLNNEYLQMKDENRTIKLSYQKINQKYNDSALKVEQQENTIKHLERNLEIMQNHKQNDKEQIQTELDQKNNEIAYLKDVIERQNRQEQQMRTDMNNQITQNKHQQRISIESLSREVSMSQLSYKQLQTTHKIELEGLLQRVKLAEDQEESMKKQLSQVMKQLQDNKRKQVTEESIAGILKKQKITEKQQEQKQNLKNKENETILNAFQNLKNEHQSLLEIHKKEMIKAKEDKIEYERKLRDMEEHLEISKSLFNHHTKNNHNNNNNPKDSTGTTTTTSVHMSQPLLSRTLTSPTEYQQSTGQTMLGSARSSYHNHNNSNYPSTARAMISTDSSIGLHSPANTHKISNNCYVKGNNKSNSSIGNHPWQHLRTHSNIEEFLLSSQTTLKKHQSTHELTQQLTDQQKQQKIQQSNQQSKIIESLIADRQPMSARTIVKTQQPISEQLFALTARGKQGSIGSLTGKDQKNSLKK